MAEYVDLSERVTATFYNDEYEEWTQQTVTIADVLDSVCDDYTVLPSAQPERKTGRWIHDGYDHPHGIDWCHCSNCGNRESVDSIYTQTDVYPYCAKCGAKMITS